MTVRTNKIENVRSISKKDGKDKIIIEGDLRLNGLPSSNQPRLHRALNGNPSGNVLEQIYVNADAIVNTNFRGMDGHIERSSTVSLTDGATYTRLYGSEFYYQPPPGAIGVRYECLFMLGWNDDHCISHWRFYFDEHEVVSARRSLSGRYMEQIEMLDWYIKIGGETDIKRGRISVWDRPIKMYWEGRDYSSGNERQKIHLTQYWDGGGSDIYCEPMVGVTSYGRVKRNR